MLRSPGKTPGSPPSELQLCRTVLLAVGNGVFCRLSTFWLRAPCLSDLHCALTVCQHREGKADLTGNIPRLFTINE
ncbi:Hypothetical predicted protein [Marmota monax]|uniref:Uncharacterized protein n=1 Tax=Marmota monax TaxID=9995 RepID=A0A5E4BHT8_MARMO|nr:hypothetical protein GHT09_015075 [Marmota monax]VTJ69147.1 Hypothetical predicted protein [Marmota monax]